MMTNKTNGRKIPRKFKEKIALLNKKQSESTAEFENIIKEVERTTRTVAAASPGKYIVVHTIHKRRNSNVRGLADNLVNSYVDLNQVCKQSEYADSSWRQTGQYQSNYYISGPQLVMEPEPSAASNVPDITLLAIDDQYTTNDCSRPQVSIVTTDTDATTTTTNANYTAPGDGYLTCHTPYSRGNARSLPNIWDGSTSNIIGNHSPRMVLSPVSSMQRLNLDQRYKEEISSGNNNNNYLNHQQQVPSISRNGSGHQLNQQRRPANCDRLYHQHHYQPQPLSKAVSSTCLPSIASGGHYHKTQQDSLYAPTGGGYMSKSISNNIDSYANNSHQHQPSSGDSSTQQYNSIYYRLQPPSPITRSHSFGQIGDVIFHQNYSKNSSYNVDNSNNNFNYSYSSNRQYPTEHYHNHHRNQDVSHSTENFSNNQCYECCNTYYPTT